MGKTGATWEIDAKGVREGDGGIVVIECRRRLSQGTKQELMGGLAFKIGDVGAQGGILVSPLDPQAGAQLIARAKGIVHVRLSPDSTTEAYVLQFLNHTFIGVQPAVFQIADLAPQVLIQEREPPIESGDRSMTNKREP